MECPKFSPKTKQIFRSALVKVGTGLGRAIFWLLSAFVFALLGAVTAVGLSVMLEDVEPGFRHLAMYLVGMFVFCKVLDQFHFPPPG